MSYRDACLSLTVRKRDGMLESRISTRRLIRDLPQGRHLKGEVILDLVRHRFVAFKPTLLDDPELDERIAREAMCLVVNIGRVPLCHPMTVVRVRQFKAKPFVTSQRIGMADLPRIALSKQLPLEVRFRGYCVLNHAIGLDELTGLNSFAKLLKLSWKALASGNMQAYLRLIDHLWATPSSNDRDKEADRAQTHALLHPFVEGLASVTGDPTEIRFVRVLNGYLKAHGAEEVKKASS